MAIFRYMRLQSIVITPKAKKKLSKLWRVIKISVTITPRWRTMPKITSSSQTHSTKKITKLKRLGFEYKDKEVKSRKRYHPKFFRNIIFIIFVSQKKDIVYFPVDAAPVYKTVQKVKNQTDDVHYKADYEEMKKQNKLNLCETPVYKTSQDVKSKTSNKAYTKVLIAHRKATNQSFSLSRF